MILVREVRYFPESQDCYARAHIYTLAHTQTHTVKTTRYARARRQPCMRGGRTKMKFCNDSRADGVLARGTGIAIDIRIPEISVEFFLILRRADFFFLRRRLTQLKEWWCRSYIKEEKEQRGSEMMVLVVMMSSLLWRRCESERDMGGCILVSLNRETVAEGEPARRCSWWLSSGLLRSERRERGFLIGTPRAGVVATAVVVGAEVDCLAAERAAMVDERFILFDAHGDGREFRKRFRLTCFLVLKVVVYSRMSRVTFYVDEFYLYIWMM
ncbi:hypothetical protein F4805DRAFT_235784 [Annulohypoxylon moriforme]|nr:hypothetical protein F4805DRAFT_235784 [Annulohypoxylon moriforme]